jgi:23S rRNA pseudouridine1911/1915/1917 synthase
VKKTKTVVKRKPIAQKPDIELVATEPCELLPFLLEKLSNRSRNNVKSLLTHKEVLVDGKIITKHDYKLRVGQVLNISQAKNRGQKATNLLDVIYEDDEIIAINKPTGLLSIATDKERELTAYNLLMQYVKIADPFGRVFAVHRLDRDTSGVFIVAKNERMKLALQKNWADLVLTRGYMAIVEGNPEEKSGKITSWLRETTTLLMYSSYKFGDGLKAITNYKVINEIDGFSLLEVLIETGRKNQIRVHMKDIGHPVVGDKKYGSTTDPIKRLGLHAFKLEFTHPFNDKVMCLEAPLPKSFKFLKDNKKSI